MTISRILAAALAVGALAVPAAQASPADNAPAAQASAAMQKQDPPADIHAPLARAATANARTQDLRHLRAGATPGATYTSGATAGHQYTPGATAAQPSTRRRVVGPPAWPPNPQPISPAHATKASDNSGVSPTTIGFGIAGGLLALAGVVGVARHTRRLGRTRVTI